MITRRLLLASLLLACTGPSMATVRAQTPGHSSCSYTQCALRVEQRFLGTRLVRGATGEPVGRLGAFGSGVNVLLAGPDSAAHYARQYRSTQRALDFLGYTSAALLLLTIATTDDVVDSRALVVGAVALNVVSLPFWRWSRRSLERSVWWYNRELAGP